VGGFARAYGPTLYAVGGVWRSFARVDMEETEYPLHVLHHYEIPRARAVKLARVVSQMSRKSLDRMGIVSRRRAEALPYGAIVLEALLQAAGLERVVISAYGLREGVLHVQLPSEERAKDPLIEFASATNARLSRVPTHAEELFAWMSPLFEQESAEACRIRKAICLFSDIGWRRHPDDRATGAFGQVITAPFAGASHRARALIATAVYHRYSGDEDFPRAMTIRGLLDEGDVSEACRVGIAARLGFDLSASALGELPQYRLRLTPTRVLLEIPRRRQAIAGEPVQKRLTSLAQGLGRRGEIVVA
jgi:exopolyphosphatase/guanosine-5'-triphosphate,3'-diphosphate pyrophosphatase